MLHTDELIVAVDLAALPRPVVIVDATPEAAGLWAGPFPSVLEELGARLAGADRPVVAFLGSPDAHPLDAVLAAVDGRGRLDLARQLGRGPVLGPSLLPALDPPRPVLVILADTDPVDMADWAGCGAVRPTVYRLSGPARTPAAGWTELDAGANLDAVAAGLTDPVTTVDLGGHGCVAVGWDAPGCRWESGRLRGRPTGPIVARFCASPGARVTATIARASGWTGPVTVVPGDLPPDPPAVPATPAEAAILRMWAAGKGFYCPGCRRSHPPGLAGCPGGGLFPSLAPGVHEADPAGGGWAVRPRPGGVVPLADGRVLVASGPASARLFAPDGDGWAGLSVDSGGLFATPAGGFALVVG